MEPDHQDDDIGRVDAADTGGLRQRKRLDVVEALTRFDAETVHFVIVEIDGKLLFLHFLHFFDFPLQFDEIPFVLYFRLDTTQKEGDAEG